MANPTVYWVKNLLGGATEVDYIEVDIAVKRGDVIIPATDKSHAGLLDTTAKFAIGVVTHDSAINTIVAYIPATPWNVFAFLTETTGYNDSTDRHTTCDFTIFTSGAMAVNPNTDSANMVWMLGGTDGNDFGIVDTAGDLAAGKYILGIFVQARYIPPQVIA